TTMPPAPSESDRAPGLTGVASLAGVSDIAGVASLADPTGVPGPAEVPARPSRADGLALLGEFTGSGLARPVFLARRADGQVVALTELLAHILEAADGARDVAAIADRVTGVCARRVSGADVAYLVVDRLMPLGLIASENGATPAPRAKALFTLAARHTLLPAPAVHRVSRVFAMLFRPAAVALLLALLVATDVWIFGRHSVRDSAAEVLATPALILVVVGLALVGALFHECGHAAACHYGGARPGVIGFGMYLVWPAFFTDVTDSYRLSRLGRLRTDLGGIYFNGLFVLLLAGALALTHAGVLVTAVVLVHLDAMRQLAPFVRLDGYYIVSDLAGVPDLFNRMGPTLRATLPRRRNRLPRGRHARSAGRARPDGLTPPDNRSQPDGLTRSARIVVTAWALLAAPLILVNLVVLMVSVPFVLTRTTRAMWDYLGLAGRATRDGKLVTAFAEVVSALLVSLPAVGMLFVLFLLARGVLRAVRAHREGGRRG
ncbi:hypothetical protein, partial [Frankia sp. CcWB3]